MNSYFNSETLPSELIGKDRAQVLQLQIQSKKVDYDQEELQSGPEVITLFYAQLS